MLGIVFTSLMVGVIMTPPYDCGRGPDLPRVTHPSAMYRAKRADALRIIVARDGQFYLDNDPTHEIRMVQDLKTRLSLGAEHKIYIEADALARYASVSKVLDAARAVGIYQIGFLTEQLKNHQP